MTRNVTMAFDDELIDSLRVYAAQHKTTVNAIFRKHALELLGEQGRRENARRRLLALSKQSAEYDETNPVEKDKSERTFSREQTYTGRRFEWPRGN